MSCWQLKRSRAPRRFSDDMGRDLAHPAAGSNARASTEAGQAHAPSRHRREGVSQGAILVFLYDLDRSTVAAILFPQLPEQQIDYIECIVIDMSAALVKRVKENILW